MSGSSRSLITYVTSNQHKVEEAKVLLANLVFEDGVRADSVFEFEFLNLQIPERLEISIEEMVRHEAMDAYRMVRVPCIVEHGGLIFDDLASKGYPGGLTKPMWDALGASKFISETRSEGRRAKAKSCVGYCDGLRIRVFHGESSGTISGTPKGDRKFYWDTVFIPDVPPGGPKGKTYAEIVGDPNWGLAYKVMKLSQAARALTEFLKFRRSEGASWLFGSLFDR